MLFFFGPFERKLLDWLVIGLSQYALRSLSGRGRTATVGNRAGFFIHRVYKTHAVGIREGNVFVKKGCTALTCNLLLQDEITYTRVRFSKRAAHPLASAPQDEDSAVVYSALRGESGSGAGHT